MGFLFLRMSGVPYIVRELAQRQRVTILVYHKPSPEAADCHFEALRRRYNIISLVDYLSYRTNAHNHLPPKPLIVTFDDGHRGNYALKRVREARNTGDLFSLQRLGGHESTLLVRD